MRTSLPLGDPNTPQAVMKVLETGTKGPQDKAG